MLTSFLNNHKDIGILLLRLSTGIGFVFVHGWGKIFGGTELWTMIGKSMSNLGITFTPGFWGFMASISEFGGGILILLGLFTRPASAFMAFTMMVAVITHLSRLDPWNKVIYPVEMLGVFLCLLFIGAGKYSLDNLIFKKKVN
jgi:putative oxidoreductase